MIESILKYAKDNQGALYQAGVGIAEIGLSYLLMPDSDGGTKNNLRASASQIVFILGFMDAACGWLRSSSQWPQNSGLPNSKEYVFALQLPVELAKFSYQVCKRSSDSSI